VWSQPAAAFVAHVQVAANQYAYTSADGDAWTRRGNMPCNGALATSPTRLVNVGFSLIGACVAVSDDGATWTSATPPSTTAMQGVFWTGSQFVGVGGNGFIATSPDGSAWTLRSSGVTATLNGGAASGSIIVVAGVNGTLVTSSDGGATWTPRTSGTTATLRRGTFTGTEFFVVGAGGTLVRSTAGDIWTTQATGYAADLRDILWIPTASRLVLVGENGLVAINP
jgi:photosystem II stability/assembly factor-like uncharacterized protein